MSIFTIDQEKCKRDGICASECPAKIITQQDKESFPELVEGGDSLCINCGHCVAVCPQGAMSLKTMASGECAPVQRDLLPTSAAVDHLIRARRSIRTYSDKPVERGLLQNLIETASYAPSGHNSQPVHWMVIQEPSEVRRMAGIVVEWMRIMIEQQPHIAKGYHFDRVVQAWEGGVDRVLRGAPHLIVAHAHKDLPMSQSSCTIALTSLELAAFASGLGACWAGYFNTCATFYKPMQAALGLLGGHQSFGAMMIGYPKFRFQRIPLRIPPRVIWR
ncbi:MAG: nitroreductase family protein [Thermodesulfobacteriota bacterium]